MLTIYRPITGMYYLDLFALYRTTTKPERIKVRQELRHLLSTDRKYIGLKDRMFEQQGEKCFYCGETFSMDALQIDHVIPVYYGGQNNINNLKLACKKCNYTKMCGQIQITNRDTIFYYENIRKEHRQSRAAFFTHHTYASSTDHHDYEHFMGMVRAYINS